MQRVTKIDVVNINGIAGVVGLRQPHATARTDSRADSDSTGTTYGGANGGLAGHTYGGAHAGTHESRSNSGQCADDEHHGGSCLRRDRSQSNPHEYHGLAVFVAGQLRSSHALQ